MSVRDVRWHAVVGTGAFAAVLWTAWVLAGGPVVLLGLLIALVLVTAARHRGDVLAPTRLADSLVASWQAGCLETVTWLNHSSALALRSATPHALTGFSVVGVDGVGLRSLTDRRMSRTSADLVMPLVLPQLRGARVVLIGGRPESLPARTAGLSRLLGPGAQVVASVDGYRGQPLGEDLSRWLERHRPDVVIVGLGAGRQEEVAQQVAQLLTWGLVMTCGGFLDQLQHDRYYPSWAYPLGLNWLVRLVREPTRLWRRYTVEAVQALWYRRDLRRMIQSQAGYLRCLRLVTGGRPTRAPARP